MEKSGHNIHGSLQYFMTIWKMKTKVVNSKTNNYYYFNITILLS